MSVQTAGAERRHPDHPSAGLPLEDAELTHTGPGTPMGELLRKFWQPVCLSSELSDLPKAIRILGEDLVAFRDHAGRVGKGLETHCAQKGSGLKT